MRFGDCEWYFNSKNMPILFCYCGKYLFFFLRINFQLREDDNGGIDYDESHKINT